MPLFDYECEKCGHVTEFLESAESKKVHRCEECGSTRMKKMLSAFSVRARCPAGSAVVQTARMKHPQRSVRFASPPVHDAMGGKLRHFWGTFQGRLDVLKKDSYY